MKDAELNYPIHKKKMLAIRDLSRRQARWMEELVCYESKFVYIKGEQNTVADALSRFPFESTTTSSAQAQHYANHPFTSQSAKNQHLLATNLDSPNTLTAAIVASQPTAAKLSIFHLQIDENWVNKLKSAYETDPWCK